MSSLIPPESRWEMSLGSPTTINPPVREWTMLSIPSRSAGPGATMSRARRSRGSCRASNSCKSSPGRADAIADDGSRNQSSLLCGEIRVERSGKRLSSRSPQRARTPAGQSSAQNTDGLEPRDRLVAGIRAEDVTEAELARLRDPPVGVCDIADLPGETDLAEAGERLAVGLKGAAGMG